MFKKKISFIVFEGIEGCGKSFQSKKLYKYLKKRGLKVLLTREPGGTKSAELIRNLILKDYFNKDNKEKFDKYTDTLLYLASRNEHIVRKIKPFLKKKYIVISDRFIDSTYAYQVSGKKVSKNFIDAVHKQILNGIKPDLTILLKLKISAAMRRIHKRGNKNRYDKFPQKFYEKTQKYFLNIAKKRKNYLILDSTKNNRDVELKIINYFKNKI